MFWWFVAPRMVYSCLANMNQEKWYMLKTRLGFADFVCFSHWIIHHDWGIWLYLLWPRESKMFRQWFSIVSDMSTSHCDVLSVRKKNAIMVAALNFQWGKLVFFGQPLSSERTWKGHRNLIQLQRCRSFWHCSELASNTNSASGEAFETIGCERRLIMWVLTATHPILGPFLTAPLGPRLGVTVVTRISRGMWPGFWAIL